MLLEAICFILTTVQGVLLEFQSLASLVKKCLHHIKHQYLLG